MGTPDFAAESLKALLKSDICEVIAVYTQPDRPCGRGQNCKPGPVKLLALENDIDVYQPANFKNREDIDQLAALRPDFLAVAAYGLILPQAVLDIPKYAPLNVHGSLLPKYRGAAPIHRAVQNGDKATGITIMRMEAGMDTGPMLLQRAVGIGIDQTTEDIHDELAQLGGEMLVETISRFPEGKLAVIPQDDSQATYAAKLTKNEGLIDWDRPVEEVHNHIRAMHPWPGAYFFWTGPKGEKIRLTVMPGKAGEEEALAADEPGDILGVKDGYLEIACQDKVYLTPKVKPQGKKALDAVQFQCGYLVRCN